MGRLLLYAFMVLLGVFVLAAALLIEHGGGPSEALTAVSVHDLSTNPQAYVNQRVSTVGVLRRAENPEEHFLVTADGLGIVIRGYNARELSRFDEQTVEVTGRFGFDAASGVYIVAERVTLAEEGGGA